MQKEVLPVTVDTKTKIKVIIDLPSFAERAAKSKIKKVGLTRIEGIIAESGKHPNYFLKQNEINKYEDVIFKGIKDIAKYFEEIWVRTSDIRSDEFSNLKGALEEKEANPMLGMHGIRYGIKNPEILKAELKALKRVSNEGKIIGLLLPQVISVEEVQEVKKFLQEVNFADAKVGVMIETPAAVQLIRELCEEKIDFISFGTNDLTQYILAVDRGNEQVQHLYNEMHPAVLHQLGYVIRVCKRNKVESSICGQAGSKKEMVKFLVGQGIDSISVNPDMAKEISDYIAELETEMTKGTDKEPRQYQPEKKQKDFISPQVIGKGEEEIKKEDKGVVEEIIEKVEDLVEDKKGEVPFIPGTENLQQDEEEPEEVEKPQEPKETETQDGKEDFTINESHQPTSDSEEQFEEEFDEEPEFKEEDKIEEKNEKEEFTEKDFDDKNDVLDIF